LANGLSKHTTIILSAKSPSMKNIMKRYHKIRGVETGRKTFLSENLEYRFWSMQVA